MAPDAPTEPEASRENVRAVAPQVGHGCRASSGPATALGGSPGRDQSTRLQLEHVTFTRPPLPSRAPVNARDRGPARSSTGVGPWLYDTGRSPGGSAAGLRVGCMTLPLTLELRGGDRALEALDKGSTKDRAALEGAAGLCEIPPMSSGRSLVPWRPDAA